MQWETEHLAGQTGLGDPQWPDISRAGVLVWAKVIIQQHAHREKDSSPRWIQVFDANRLLDKSTRF